MTANSLTAERETQTNLLTLCAQSLSILPTTADFEVEFQRVSATINPSQP